MITVSQVKKLISFHKQFRFARVKSMAEVTKKMKLKTKCLYMLVGTFFFLPITSGAQTEMMDSLRVAFHDKPKPFLDFGTRNSFVQNSRADIWGIQLGLSFHKRVVMGIGYNYMSSDLTQPLLLDGKAITMHMDLNYLSIYFSYTYFKNKHWQFSIPLQMGAGTSGYHYSFAERNYTQNKEFIALYEPMVETDYYIFSWLGAYVDVGLRLMLKPNTQIERNFNSPMYAFGLFIAWDELYKTVLRNTRRTKNR
jgi:hypothetical protein